MLAVEEHESDEELFDDDWAVDFFDDEDVKDNDIKDSEQAGIAKTYAPEPFNDIWPADFFDEDDLKDNENSAAWQPDPLDVLERIHALALRNNSKTSQLGGAAADTVGNGKLVVSVAMAESGDALIDVVSVDFCGFAQFEHSLPMACKTRGPAPHYEPAYFPIAAPVGGKEFPRLRKIFGKVHLTELRLVNVPIDARAFRPLAEFIAGCTFDRLTLAAHKTGFWREGTDALISRACKDVVIEARLHVAQMRAIKRPVTFRCDKANLNSQQYIYVKSEEDFANLVLFGHNFIGFNILIRTFEVMKMIVETISASPDPRKMDICGLGYSITDQYVKFVSASQVQPLPASAKDIPASKGMKVWAYQHLGATIFLIQRPGWVDEGRLIVTSASYSEE